MKRYLVTSQGDMMEHEHGRWVLIEDVQILMAERDRYKAAFERIAAVEDIAATARNLREQVPWLQNRGYAGMVLLLSRAAAQLEMAADAVRG